MRKVSHQSKRMKYAYVLGYESRKNVKNNIWLKNLSVHIIAVLAAKSRIEKGSTTIPMGVESSDSKSLTRKI